MNEAAVMLRWFALALCAFREASDQSLLGKTLVCQVIENRVKDKRWPDMYVGVITQPLQISSFNQNDPNILRWPREDDIAWADCVAAAKFVLDAPSPLTTANHYHAIGANPSWADSTRIVVREGKHIFYCL